jgi:hypothetical protein
MITIAVKNGCISMYLKRNSIFEKFKKNFINLAKTKVLSKIDNPVLTVEDFPIASSPILGSNDFIEVKLSYGDRYSEENLQMMCQEVANTLVTFLQEFQSTAVGYMMAHSEFIPLEGYSFENLKKESTAALQANRRFILIKNYDQYLSINPQTGTCKFDIKIIDPVENKDEYAAVYCILQKNPEEAQKELIKKYSDQLVEDDWTKLS